MKIKAILIIGMIIGIVAITGCISTSENKHFDKQNISFDYPGTWNITSENNPMNITGRLWMITIKNPEDIGFTISIFADTLPADRSGSYTKINSIKISGVNAQGYEGDNGHSKFYDFTKNGKYYSVTIRSLNFNSDDFAKYKNEINIILNSIQIK